MLDTCLEIYWEIFSLHKIDVMKKKDLVFKTRRHKKNLSLTIKR